MNVDVQGSLFPNLLTMLVQLTSTFIIFICIKKWLWKPVKNILNKRADAMQENINAAVAQNDEAKKNLEESKKELEEAKKASKEIIESSRVEATNLKNEIVADAKKQAQAKLDDADEKIVEAKKQAQADLHKEMVDVAMAAVSKLLEEKADSKDDEKAIDKYINEVKK